MRLSCFREGCSPEWPCERCQRVVREARVAASLRRKFGYCSEEMLQTVMAALDEERTLGDYYRPRNEAG